MVQYKAKVITAEYMESKDLLVFTMLNLETGKEQTYCWPPCDYFAAIGISKYSSYTPEQLHRHCEQMLGKQMNFVLEGEEVIPAAVIDHQKAEHVTKECSEMAEQASDLLEKELAAAKEISKMRYGDAR